MMFHLTQLFFSDDPVAFQGAFDALLLWEGHARRPLGPNTGGSQRTSIRDTKTWSSIEPSKVSTGQVR